MDQDQDASAPESPLDQEILVMYERALRHRKPTVAEHLLRALEELAQSDPACRCALEEAYLLIDLGVSSPDPSGGRDDTQ
jgi:hypothetical protein